MDGSRILIVDDDEVLAFEIKSCLEDHGYHVVGHAPSAERALDLAQRFAPDIALVDIGLGGNLDGIDVARELRKRPGTAVVYVTGHADPRTVGRAKETAPAGYLMKPFSNRELVVTLELAVVRQQLEAKQRAEQRTQRLDAIGVLAGGIAHDFNNLLAVIAASVSFAARRMPPNERNVLPLLERALAACDRATGLTKQLLTFSSGGAPVRRTVALADLVRSTAEFALHGSKHKALFDVPPDLMAADVDEGQIGQIITNLVMNATEAMPLGGTIQIRCANRTLEDGNPFLCTPGPYVEIAVTDQGGGIAPEILDRIFEPYFSTKKRGSGLGLATAYSIAKQHGGALAVESKPEAGATFRLLLPANPGGKIPQAVDLGDEGPTPKLGLRVLVMDDEEALRTSMTMVLDELGCEIECAPDGAEAIRSFIRAKENGCPFDVVILDLTVRGGMGGLETVKHLLAIDPGTRAIATSGYAPDPALGHPTRYGFVASLPKPFRLHELAAVVRGVTQRH
jgi:signal transduction histidine kinase